MMGLIELTEHKAAQIRLNELFYKRIELLAANPGWTGKGPADGKSRPCGCRTHHQDLTECPYCGKRILKGTIGKVPVKCLD